MLLCILKLSPLCVGQEVGDSWGVYDRSLSHTHTHTHSHSLSHTQTHTQVTSPRGFKDRQGFGRCQRNCLGQAGGGQRPVARRIPERPLLCLSSKRRLRPSVAPLGGSLLRSAWMLAAVKAAGLEAPGASGRRGPRLFCGPLHIAVSDAGWRLTIWQVWHGCHGQGNHRAGLTSSWCS